jgi:hypothetical protein
MAPTLTWEPIRHFSGRHVARLSSAVSIRELLMSCILDLTSKHARTLAHRISNCVSPMIEIRPVCTEWFVTLDANALHRNARRNERAVFGSDYGKWKSALKSRFVGFVLPTWKFSCKITNRSRMNKIIITRHAKSYSVLFPFAFISLLTNCAYMRSTFYCVFLPFGHHHIRTFAVDSTAHTLHWPMFTAGVFRVVFLLTCSGLTLPPSSGSKNKSHKKSSCKRRA